MRLSHYLLTNFNVKRDDRPARPDAAWLEHRFELFERFCLPSVAAQTCADFSWLVRWDEAGMSPDQRDRLLVHEAALPCLQLLPEQVSFRLAIGRILDAGRLLTTRLDNDDALHRDAIGLLQQEAGADVMEFLNLPLGYCYEHPSGRALLVEQPSNPFLSLAEEVNGSGPRTAVSVSHKEAASLAPVRQVSREPSWLQVIHGRNVWNRLEGRPCDPPDLGLFGIEVH